MDSKILCFGELLWDMLPEGPVLGGAPSNLATHLHALGGSISLVTRIGNDDLGEKALKRMQTKELDLELLQLDTNHPTGTVEVSINNDTGEPQFDIKQNVAYDHIQFNQQLANTAKQTDCICFGTLAQRNPESRKTLERIIAAAGSHAIFFLDINLREGCYNFETVKSSLERADILKISDSEAVYLAEQFGFNYYDPYDVAESLMDMFQIVHCVITLGKKGVIGVSQEKERFYIPGHIVDVKDTCGSGDAFSAGYLHMLLRDSTPQVACQVGNALGALVARHPGATPEIHVKEIRRFMASGASRVIDPQFEQYFRQIETQLDCLI
jgi:fructokinase